MASPGREGALQTPRPEGQAGILRSPRTPGTGSSVRFGMRIYETGEESVLSASQGSSIYPIKDADASGSMQLSDMSNLDEQHTSLQESMSMEMSFTESFLKREVGDALAGLAQSTSESLLPTTPGAKPALPAPAPDTIRARPGLSSIQQESTSPLDSPLPAEPTMQAEGKTKHADGWPAMYEFSYLTEKDELDEEEAGELVPYALEELTNKLVSIDSLGNVDARELLETVAQLDRTHTERTIFLQHRLARSYRLNQVLRTNLHHAQERLAAFESHVTNLLDHQPASDAPVAEELRRLAMQLEERLQKLPSMPMLAIEPSRDDNARDTERASLEEARAELVREQEAHEVAQAYLNQARAQLDLERIQLQDEQRRIEQEQTELRQAQLQHDMERRDLEIRLAAQPSTQTVSEEEVERRIAHAVVVARESALRDAEVRHAQAQPATPSEGDAALRAEIDRLHAELERRTQSDDDVIASLQSEIESLHTKLAQRQGEAWEAHVTELERMLDGAEADAQAAQESFRNQELERLELQTQLEERVAELENQVHEGAQAVLRLSKAKQESEAELTATIHNQRKRIHSLEHDVAHRGLELVKLEKQKENLAKEAMHFSLALSAKDQELHMLKRGTQNAKAHWKVLAQRNAPERRALQPQSTNSARRVSSEAAKRMVQQGTPSVGLASTPNPVRRDLDRRLPSVPSKGLPDLSTSTIASAELSYRP
ncbi:hypothetical protein MBRA1_000847 [Malassezia brasiliensis]|uniref:Uncharacterized protein n=1 Tax=Malassezia brasiliensis TaxID=1821822 RepID=A0AAF0IMN9_9BASI|nr:hypothetical protein MBRA1_000847 [Malassezia brasiliensis]